jgi:cell division protein ZapB
MAMTDTAALKIARLEAQINELLELCRRLDTDNRNLRAQFQHLSSERSSLLEHREQARIQVEAMITRLRSLENA